MYFFNTNIANNAQDKVKEVIDSTFLSEGKVVKEFEDNFEKHFSTNNFVAVNSGTSALHLALLASGVGEGDEVIIPAQTFIATGLAVLYTGAKIVFADIEIDTGNICPDSIEEKITNKTKAIIPVHWAGYPCDMEKINSIAKKYNIKVVEDAAHAVGAIYKNQNIGSLSDFTCFSFQAIKHLTTGDGGGICCKNKEDYEKIKRLRWFGIDREKHQTGFLGERLYNLEEVGFKYHMNNVSAAIGLANLENIDNVIKRHREISSLYYNEFSDIQGIELMKNDSDIISSCWFLQLLVENREGFVNKMNEHNIAVSVVHQRIDRNEIFGGLDKSLVNQELFDKKQIALPIHIGLSNEDIEKIISVVKKGW